MNLAELQAAKAARVEEIKGGAVQRAYAVLEIKSIDEDERVIEGIATTPTPDSMDDIVESEGAEFSLPLPFLKQHKSDQPIGNVIKAKVTKDGIAVVVKLAKVSEPPALKERLDVAWAEIKAGLIRGLSIGFSPIEWSDIKGSYGLRYTRWSWRELSAVVIPANHEAEIQAIKALDREHLRAASGHNAGTSVVRLKTSPGVSGKSPISLEIHKVKTTREQIEAFEAKLAATLETRTAIMQKASEEGRTLDDEEKQKYDAADGDVKQITEHLDRLKALEVEEIKRAKPVTPAAGTSPQAEQRSGIISVRANVEKGIPFARYVMAMAMARGNPQHALAIAESRKHWVDTSPQVITAIKTAVAGGTSHGSAWADDLVYNQNLAADFIELLRPMTIIGQMQNLRRVPFNIRVGSITSGGSAYWVGQGVPIPVSKLQTGDLTLERTKSAGLMVITEELARDSSPSAELLIRNDLRDTIAQFLDRRFIDPQWAAVANVSPASITNDVTAVAASGTTLAALRTDIQTLFANFISNNIPTSGGVWIMTETTALALSLMTDSLGQRPFDLRDMNSTGGTFVGRPVIVSQNTNVSGSPTIGNLIIFAIPSEIMLADEGGVDVDASREASVQMDDAPTNNAATGTGASVVSMWQTNSVAIRAIRYINWKKRRQHAVQYITNALYVAS